MEDILLRTAERLGMTIRMKRKEKGWSQSALADMLGVERKWVLRLEAGNPKAELGLVLKALSSLGVRVSLSEGAPSPKVGDSELSSSRLDEVFRRVQRPAVK